MTEKRCKNFDEFNEFYKMLIQRVERVNYTHASPAKQWDNMCIREMNFLKKYGYLDIVFNERNHEFSIKKRKKGRPCNYSKTKSRKVSVRLEEKTFNALEDYCVRNNEDRSTVIRKLIDKFLENNVLDIQDEGEQNGK